jgi:alanyl-tRNA synthetase
VEAVSGMGSLEWFRTEHSMIRALEEQLSVPGERILPELERREDQLRKLQRELEEQRVRQMRERFAARVAEAPIQGGVRVFAERADGLAPAEMRELADALRGGLSSGVVVLGRAEGGKTSLLVAVTADLRDRLPAGRLVKKLGRLIGGGGGGRPDLAEAGGKNPERLDEAIAQAGAVVRKELEASEN